MNVTLRIKRKYFDQILTGEKTIEYRDVKPFYDKLFKQSECVKTLTLHYQQARKIICDVVAIVKMPTPKSFQFDEITFGKETYAIVLKNARLI